MEKSHVERIDPSETTTALNAHIQERVNSGHEMPTGWLFTGLTLFFYDPSDPPETQNENEDENPSKPGRKSRLRIAANTALFAGAHIATNIADTSVTHVVVDEGVSSEQVSAVRESFARGPRKGGRKLPHLVTVDWVEVCWEQRTVLDEERTFLSLSFC